MTNDDFLPRRNSFAPKRAKNTRFGLAPNFTATNFCNANVTATRQTRFPFYILTFIFYILTLKSGLSVVKVLNISIKLFFFGRRLDTARDNLFFLRFNRLFAR